LKLYYWVGVIAFVVLGITTLVPVPASKPSLLGYYAHRPLYTYKHDNSLDSGWSDIVVGERRRSQGSLNVIFKWW